jgi:ribonuclease D
MLESVKSAHRLAIDMEADSLYHYFEKVCLIQLSTDSNTFVLDTLAVKDVDELGPIMRNCSVEKVFHAAAYDVLSLRRDYGFSFRSLFDTHLAAQLLGYEQLGLDVLLESLLGVVHSKRRQRDDWSRRPLETEQLQYAAMDTRHLLRLRDLLETQLRDKGRLSWAQEEFLYAADPSAQEKQFDPEGYLRIKGIRELSPEELAVLRALYLLRDRYARTLDTPPFKVINNSVLLNLAHKPPASPGELFKRSGISYRVARKFSGEIYRTIKKAKREHPVSQRPNTRTPYKTLNKEARNLLERLKSWRQSKARVLGLHVGVIFPGNLLELLAVSPPGDQAALEAMDGMRHWRVREFGPEILKILHSG